MIWDGNGPKTRPVEWIPPRHEAPPAAFESEDLTGTFWFMAKFFIITLLAAAAVIGGTVALIRWAVGL